MRRIVCFILAAICVLPLSARKEYRALRENLKNSRGDAALSAVQNLLKDKKVSGDPELWHYGVEAYLKINEVLNRSAYLKQKYDTAKLFASVYGMYDFAVRCDSVETARGQQRGKTPIRYKYRDDHGSLLRSQYANLWGGGQFLVMKKDFKSAYNYFSMYAEIRPSPLFGGKAMKRADSLKLTRAAYWATVCAYQMGDTAKFRRYNAAALLDTTYRQKELELTARLCKATGNVAGMLRALETGVREFPQQEYFFTNLSDHYTASGQVEKSLALADTLLQRDPRSLMAQYGRSIALLKLRRYDDCIAVGSSILQSDSTYAGAYYNVGSAYLEKAMQIRSQVRTDMKIDQLRSLKREEDKLLRTAMPYLEHYRQLQPQAVEWWGRPLYTIYLSLNIGDKFEEVERAISQSEKAAAEAKAVKK